MKINKVDIVGNTIHVFLDDDTVYNFPVENIIDENDLKEKVKAIYEATELTILKNKDKKIKLKKIEGEIL